MTNRTQDPIACSSGGQKDWSLHSIEIESELENLDRDRGREYVPMDVFLDRRTIEEHFQVASLHAGRRRIH